MWVKHWNRCIHGAFFRKFTIIKTKLAYYMHRFFNDSFGVCPLIFIWFGCVYSSYWDEFRTFWIMKIDQTVLKIWHSEINKLINNLATAFSVSHPEITIVKKMATTVASDKINNMNVVLLNTVTTYVKCY